MAIPEELVQNLDGQTPEDLRDHAQRLLNYLLSTACNDTDCVVVRNLYLYATHKYTAMKLRSSGNVNAALITEAYLDKLYKQLPENARW